MALTPEEIEKVNGLYKQIDALTDQNRKLKSDMTVRNTQLRESKARITELETKLDELKSEVDSLKEDNKTLEADNDRMTKASVEIANATEPVTVVPSKKPAPKKAPAKKAAAKRASKKS